MTALPPVNEGTNNGSNRRIDQKTIDQVKSKFQTDFLALGGGGGVSIEFPPSEDGDTLGGLDAPHYVHLSGDLATSPSRKGSVSNESFRRRSVSLPEKIWTLDQNGHLTSQPARKVNIGRSNSMPLISEYGRLASFPTNEYLSSLPIEISQRVEGVNLRVSELARKKIILQSRAKAIKERELRNSKRILYFKTAQEREVEHKRAVDGDLPENENEIYDCFPTILFLAGFTGVTHFPNNASKKELGLLKSYPMNTSHLSDLQKAIIAACENRRLFAQKKKAELLKRSKERKSRKLSTMTQGTIELKLERKSSTSSVHSRVSIDTNDTESVKDPLPPVSKIDPKDVPKEKVHVPIQRRNSLSLVDERLLTKQKPLATEETKPDPVMKGHAKRRSSFSILDWSPISISGISENQSTKQMKKKSPSKKSLLDETTLQTENSLKPDRMSIEIAGELEPEQVYAAISRRRGSIPLTTPTDERRPASEVIQEFNSQLPMKGSWRITDKNKKKLYGSITSLADYQTVVVVSMNPLFNADNIDFTETPKEGEEAFKRKLGSFQSEGFLL